MIIKTYKCQFLKKQQKMQKRDNNKQKSESAVKVFVRVRPLISIEQKTDNIVSVKSDEQSVTIYIDQYNQIETKFDRIISQDKNQKQMFESVQPFIDRILDAFNLTIFAYGQTGSGKTYTMFGKDWENNFQELEKAKKSMKQNTPLTDVANDNNFAGLIPRSTYHLFNCLDRRKGQFNVYCSFIQIYNEKVYDLLQDSPIPNPLSIHQSKFEGIFVEGLGEFQVNQYTDCLQLMRRGEKNRFIRQTSMNAKSSRSHTIFQILIQSTSGGSQGNFTRARLNLCDLAGSEKINKKEAMTNDHLEELKNINLSLTTLGKVINSLSKDGTKNTAIFRQSKLTRLLQESLVGNTNTIIVGAISPSSKNRQQTVNTLKFVERARHIKLTIKPSSVSNQSGELVQRLKQEMMELRRILQEKQKTAVPKEIEQRLKQLELENKKLKSETTNKNQDIYTLVEQNHKIKQALVRMEKVAIEQLSNATFHMTEDSELYEDMKSKFKQSIRFNELKPPSRLEDQSMYARFPNIKNQLLPPITQRGSKLNRSLEVIPESTGRRPAAMLIDSKGKRQIINHLQKLEAIQKKQQSKLLNDLETIEQTQRVKSEHIRGKSLNLRSNENPNYSTLQNTEFKSKPKKKQDFSDKIKQLENRLKKPIK